MPRLSMSFVTNVKKVHHTYTSKERRYEMKRVELSIGASKAFDRDPQGTVHGWHRQFGTSTLSAVLTDNATVMRCGNKIVAILI